MPPSSWVVVAVVTLLFVGLGIWSVARHVARRKAMLESLAGLGFRPCPEENESLEATIARIEDRSGSTYTVKDARRRRGDPPVYFFVKWRRSTGDDLAVPEDELLFPVLRRTGAGVVLTLKPSALAHGRATRLIQTIAKSRIGESSTDLALLELPPRLRESNVLAALGPAGSKLEDLVPAAVLAVVKDFGDAGVLQVRFRDTWCAVSGIGMRIPFQVEALLLRIRPLLQAIEPLAPLQPALARVSS